MTTNLKRVKINGKDIWVDGADGALSSTHGKGVITSRNVTHGNKSEIRISEDPSTKIGAVILSIANYDIKGSSQNPVLLFHELKEKNLTGGSQIDILSESGGVDQQYLKAYLQNDCEENHGPNGSIQFVFVSNPVILTNS